MHHGYQQSTLDSSLRIEQNSVFHQVLFLSASLPTVRGRGQVEARKDSVLADKGKALCQEPCGFLSLEVLPSEAQEERYPPPKAHIAYCPGEAILTHPLITPGCVLDFRPTRH